MATYKIVCFYADPNKANHVVAQGLTREEAEEHCSDPETSSRTCTFKTGKMRTQKYGHWFHGFQEE